MFSSRSGFVHPRRAYHRAESADRAADGARDASTPGFSAGVHAVDSPAPSGYPEADARKDFKDATFRAGFGVRKDSRRDAVTGMGDNTCALIEHVPSGCIYALRRPAVDTRPYVFAVVLCLLFVAFAWGQLTGVYAAGRC
jgi:hypothetical protein